MTAVEWLADEIIILEERLRQEKINLNDFMDLKDDLVTKALEMEKQQIIYCGNTCAIKQHIHIEKVKKMTMDEMLEYANTKTLTLGEEYYNETFKNQLQG